jgi:hypothetical protein
MSVSLNLNLICLNLIQLSQHHYQQLRQHQIEWSWHHLLQKPLHQ